MENCLWWRKLANCPTSRWTIGAVSHRFRRCLNFSMCNDYTLESSAIIRSSSTRPFLSSSTPAHRYWLPFSTSSSFRHLDLGALGALRCNPRSLNRHKRIPWSLWIWRPFDLSVELFSVEHFRGALQCLNIISTLQLFGPACLVYLLSDVRPTVELGDSLNQEGVFNPFLV